MNERVKILHVEDNPGDIRLTQIAISELNIPAEMNVVTDGEQAIAYLRREAPFQNSTRPDLILLDLNIPRFDGREVLREIKKDPSLRRIPVIIFTSSEADQDINTSYDLQANCYIRKSESFDEFLNVFRTIENFWFKTAKLPAA